VPPERYRDFRKIGQGGMGIVYLALDTELNRSVAFKVVRPGAAAGDLGETPTVPLALSPPTLDTPASKAFESLKARFLQEAWVTGGMEHPGIVPVYEVGQTAEGVPYYTMRFVKGTRTLANAIQGADGKPIAERLALLEPFLKVCDAVRYAHAHGVIHRDLKPENVALGEFGEVVVLDWGLARVKGAAEPETDRWLERIAELRQAADLQTQPGMLGTPGYLAPEAASGTRGAVDERSDVYSLGAMLFRLLTGRLPHETTSLAQFLGSLLLEEAPTALSLDASVPAPLSHLCARALAREPAARTPSVEALAQGVRDWQREADEAREIEALMRDGNAALALAEGLEGRARLRALDRGISAVEQVFRHEPMHAGARGLRERIGHVRVTAERERDRAARRRALGRTLAIGCAALALVGFGLAWWAVRNREEPRGLAGPAEAWASRPAGERAETLAARSLAEGLAGRPIESRLAAAQSLAIHDTEAGRAALARAWGRVVPRLIARRRPGAPIQGAAPKARSEHLVWRVQGASGAWVLAGDGSLWRYSMLPEPYARDVGAIPPLPAREEPSEGFEAAAASLDASGTNRLLGLAIGDTCAAAVSSKASAWTWELSGGKSNAPWTTEATGGVCVWTDRGRTWVLVGTSQGVTVSDAYGASARRLGAALGTVRALALARGVLFVGTEDAVHALDLETGETQRRFEGGGTVLAVSETGRTLAAAGTTLRVWDVATGALRRDFGPADGAGLRLAVSDDRLVTSTAKGGVRVWDLHGGNAVARLGPSTGTLRPVAFAGDSERVLVGADDAPGVDVWQLDDPTQHLGGRVRVPEVASAAVDGVWFQQRGPAALAWLAPGPIEGSHPLAWSDISLMLRALRDVPEDATCAAVGRSGALYVGMRSGSVRVLRPGGGLPAADHGGRAVTALAIEPGEKRLWSTAEGSTELIAWMLPYLGRERIVGLPPPDPDRDAPLAAGERRTWPRLEVEGDSEALWVEEQRLGPAGTRAAARSSRDPWRWTRIGGWLRLEGVSAWALAPGVGRAVLLEAANGLVVREGAGLGQRTRIACAAPAPGEDAPELVVSDDASVAVLRRKPGAAGFESAADGVQVEVFALEPVAGPFPVSLGAGREIVGLSFLPGTRTLVSASKSDVRLHDLTWLVLPAAERLRWTEERWGLRMEGLAIIPR
jgi:serine/threonine protein kinase